MSTNRYQAVIVVLALAIMAVSSVIVLRLIPSDIPSILPVPEAALVARGSTNYGWLRVEEVVLSGTGTEGAVDDSALTSTPVRGHLYAVHLAFNTSITDTTDFTLTQASPALTVLQLTDHYTDTWYYPVAQQTDSDGAGTSTYDRLPVNSQLTAEVGETISSTTIMTVTVYWGE